MSEPFLGEIRLVGFNFAPRSWAFNDRQILPISQNQSLYSLLGTTYGGDGRTTFALPDFRGRTGVHFGSSPVAGAVPRNLGEKGGFETVTLATGELPPHRHEVRVNSDDGNQPGPANHYFANANVSQFGVEEYVPASGASAVAMGNDMISTSGGGQSHNNMQPYLTVNFCIAMQGLFPSRN